MAPLLADVAFPSSSTVNSKYKCPMSQVSRTEVTDIAVRDGRGSWRLERRLAQRGARATDEGE